VGSFSDQVCGFFRDRQHRVQEDLIDALANIAVIGPTINIRISAKDPMDYIDRYAISHEKLAQQFIDTDVGSMLVDNFQGWLAGRAGRLADASNSFLAELWPRAIAPSEH
jgi:hypothetical protein